MRLCWGPTRSSGSCSLDPAATRRVSRAIAALAVDNEPTVFWDGSDADSRARAWKDQYFDPAMGRGENRETQWPFGIMASRQHPRPAHRGRRRQPVRDGLPHDLSAKRGRRHPAR